MPLAQNWEWAPRLTRLMLSSVDFSIPIFSNSASILFPVSSGMQSFGWKSMSTIQEASLFLTEAILLRAA